jgi:hypothetical protein
MSSTSALDFPRVRAAHRHDIYIYPYMMMEPIPDLDPISISGARPVSPSRESSERLARPPRGCETLESPLRLDRLRTLREHLQRAPQFRFIAWSILARRVLALASLARLQRRSGELGRRGR